jgi:Raf kinase inhibitor-like YbhB/YbcL family protein
MTDEVAKLTVTSRLFDDGETIPTSAAHSLAGGNNTSPDLSWSGAPEGTRAFAVTCYDPDAPTGIGFVHWVVFNIDPSVAALHAGVGSGEGLPPGSVLGYTDWGENAYGGMAPPPGDEPHRYQFTVYALDTPLELGTSTTYAMLQFAMRGHVLAKGTLTGRFAVSP